MLISNIIGPVIFAGALTTFAGALPRGPHPGDGAARNIAQMRLRSRYKTYYEKHRAAFRT